MRSKLVCSFSFRHPHDFGKTLSFIRFASCANIIGSYLNPRFSCTFQNVVCGKMAPQIQESHPSYLCSFCYCTPCAVTTGVYDSSGSKVHAWFFFWGRPDRVTAVTRWPHLWKMHLELVNFFCLIQGVSNLFISCI